MLLILSPFPDISIAINKFLYSEAVPFIVFIFSFIPVSLGVYLDSVAFLVVIEPFSDIERFFGCNFSQAMLESFMIKKFELTDIFLIGLFMLNFTDELCGNFIDSLFK